MAVKSQYFCVIAGRTSYRKLTDKCLSIVLVFLNLSFGLGPEMENLGLDLGLEVWSLGLVDPSLDNITEQYLNSIQDYYMRPYTGRPIHVFPYGMITSNL